MPAPRIFPVLLGLTLLLAAAAPAAAPAAVREAMESIRQPAIRAHLAFLADDLLEGRAPGSRGGAIAARYIAAQLAASGIEPMGDSYYQVVPLTGWTPRPQRTHLDFAAGQRTLVLRHGDDAVLWTAGGADSASVTGEVVFIGYGVTAPEYDWDDFKGRDLTGRIAVVLVPDPPAPPQQDIFDGRAMSYYGRWTYKVEEAARKGAAAVLVVHTPDGAGYSWNVVRSSFSGEQLSLRGGTQTPRPAVQGWVSLDAAQRLFALNNLNLSELYVRAARRDFQPVFTGVTASLRAVGSVRRFQSANVVGIVTGRHPTRRNEAVVYTAHYDGLGIGAPVNGDSIYNGAYDNASGVAALLEIARAFASLDTPPDRSLVFLFPTAEEAGLLGSTWYTQQPPVALQRTVAALNLDGVNIWGETDDVGGVGLERSTLGGTFERQAAVLGLRVTGDRAPERGFFFRSDHFPFAQAGVPALFIDHGVTFRNRPAGWGGNILNRFEADRYHLPGDRYEPGMDLAGAVQQARLAFLVGHDVASTPERPRWYPGAAIPR